MIVWLAAGNPSVVSLPPRCFLEMKGGRSKRTEENITGSLTMRSFCESYSGSR